MKKLTAVTDTVLMLVREASDNPIYRADPPRIMIAFKEKFPDVITNTILQQAALLAGDIVVVNRKNHKYFLMFPEEDAKLREINGKILAANQRIRRGIK